MEWNGEFRWITTGRSRDIYDQVSVYGASPTKQRLRSWKDGWLHSCLWKIRVSQIISNITVYPGLESSIASDVVNAPAMIAWKNKLPYPAIIRRYQVHQVFVVLGQVLNATYLMPIESKVWNPQVHTWHKDGFRIKVDTKFEDYLILRTPTFMIIVFVRGADLSAWYLRRRCPEASYGLKEDPN